MTRTKKTVVTKTVVRKPAARAPKKVTAKSEFVRLTAPMISRRQGGDDQHHHRLLAATCYLWILCVVPLVTQEENSYVRFHAKQGVVLALAWLALWIIAVIPLLGWLVFLFGSIALLAINVAAIVHAWYGDEWELPYLAKFVHKLAW